MILGVAIANYPTEINLPMPGPSLRNQTGPIFTCRFLVASRLQTAACKIQFPFKWIRLEIILMFTRSRYPGHVIFGVAMANYPTVTQVTQRRLEQRFAEFADICGCPYSARTMPLQCPDSARMVFIIVPVYLYY